MAEIKSRQAAVMGTTAKILAASVGGKVRKAIISSPATVAWANGDTLASGVRVPKGARFTLGSQAVHAAMGTSVKLDVGVRNFDTKEVVDADGIAAAVDVAAAGAGTVLANGALLAAGSEYIADQDLELYATLSGGTPTANAQIRIEVEYVTND